jgi:dCMP deaminase
MNKIPYDDYFLTMAYLVAQRSIDPSSKCGAILVGAENQVLSTGYNGPIRGSDDDMIPLERPAKYAHMIHAEENCILAFDGGRPDLDGATIYVTGAPCHKCLRMIIQKGIYNIVYANGNKTVMHDEEENKRCQMMLDYTKGSVTVRVVDNFPQIVGLLGDTAAYVIRKNPGKVP